MRNHEFAMNEGDQVKLSVRRLSSWDTEGRERCIVWFHPAGDIEYYGVATEDRENGIRHIYVPEIDKTFSVAVVNA